MATTQTLTLALLLLHLSSPILAAAASPIATLDVASSLSLARSAASFDPSSVSQLSASAAEGVDVAGEGGGVLLHSRDFLPGVVRLHAADYRSLTLARLSRDATRAAAISARVSLAVDGVRRADLRPVEEQEVDLTAAAIEGPVVSGVSQGSGEYFSRVGVGTPAQQLFVVLDTGSDVTWVQCQPCAECYPQTDPLFDPSASSSFSAVPCGSPKCRALDASACRNSTGSCVYEVAYGDGSYTVGDLATDTITLGRSAPVSGVAFGCGHDNEGLFVGAAGLFALGGGSLSFPSQIAARSFSYCLVDRDSQSASTLQVGEPVAVSSGVVAAPLVRNAKTPTFYYVALTGISVGGQLLGIPASAFSVDSSGRGGVIVDSGTAVTRLQPSAYAAVRDAFAAMASALPRTSGVSLFDTCYDLSGRTTVQVPAVAFHFAGGSQLRLPAKNYLIPVDGDGTYCLAFASAGSSAPVSIIGNVQQQGTRVAFDLGKGVVAFTPNQC